MKPKKRQISNKLKKDEAWCLSRSRWLKYPAFGTLLGVLVVLVYSLQCTSWKSYFTIIAYGIVFSLLFVAAGVLVGILFGLPRKLQQEREFENQKPTQTNKCTTKEESSIPYESNSNLETVSDWLTKIIVGVGLIEVRNIAVFMESVSSQAAVALGNYPSSYAFALSLSLYSFIDGFLLGYFWARFYLLALLIGSENPKLMDKGDEDPPELSEDSLDDTKPPSILEEKILHTLWRLQALHSATLKKAITFTILPASAEFDEFYSSVNRLIRQGLLLPSEEGQYYLSVKGLHYCLHNAKNFKSGYWYEDEQVSPDSVRELEESIRKKYPPNDKTIH